MEGYLGIHLLRMRKPEKLSKNAKTKICIFFWFFRWNSAMKGKCGLALSVVLRCCTLHPTWVPAAWFLPECSRLVFVFASKSWSGTKFTIANFRTREEKKS
jgi:hypothetical protein